MDSVCCSFPPVIDESCRVLVLGSMPGEASLAAAQYYAHPRNAFWPILYRLFEGGAPDADYDARLAFALKHRVAIWDMAETCVREGSLDSDIKSPAPNALLRLLEQYPSVRALCFNGRTARALYDRLTPGAAGDRILLDMPSTSPAYTLRFDEKLARWREMRRWTEQK